MESGLDQFLFNSGELRDVLESRIHQMKAELNSLPKGYLKSIGQHQICQRLAAKYCYETPVLRVEEMDHHIDKEKRTAVCTVPFDGNLKLFLYRPSKCYGDPPRGTITGGTSLSLSIPCGCHDDLCAAANRGISTAKHWLDQVRSDIDRFNESLYQVVEDCIYAQ